MLLRLRPRWALLLFLAGALGTGVDFARRTQSTFEPTNAPIPGIVFTGQFNRVDAGLALLQKRAIKPLLITGVNQGAGIPISSFAQQFHLSPALLADLGDLVLVLGPSANNTLQNALETRQWLASQPCCQPVVLITSQFHMPRASLALEQALRDRQVLRYVVTDDKVQYAAVAVDFWKYLGTIVVGWGVN